MKNMKTLIIHPNDVSTDFLKPIYAGIKSKTVVRKNVSQDKLTLLIQSHGTIIMLGHGASSGLFNVSGIGKGIMAVGDSMVKHLRGKQLIAIWCNADKFIKHHQLDAMYSGMFISEVSEAKYCGVEGNQAQVNESNDTFAVLLGNMLGKVPTNLKEVYSMVGESYEELGEVNPIAKYNSERWYYNVKQKDTLAVDSVKTPTVDKTKNNLLTCFTNFIDKLLNKQ
jgi:hypothetical protein